MGNNFEIALPREIYLNHLKVINGVAFSVREIDVISCVLQGRSAKRIGSLLMISPKTVENHLRNIMLKVGCNSQESIIDFIEKSGQFVYIKAYYSSLLIKIAFESQLKKIIDPIKHLLPSCLIVYHKEEQGILPLISQLEDHLKFIGIKSSIETKEAENIVVTSVNQAEYTIYCLSEIFLKNIPKKQDILQSEKSILLLFDTTTSIMFEKHDLLKQHIDITNSQKYYFAFFEVLKILFPAVNFEQNILTFKQYYTTLIEPINNKLFIANKFNNIYSIFQSILKQKKLILLSTLCLVFCIGLIYKKGQNSFEKEAKQKYFFIDNKDSLYTVVTPVFRKEIHLLFSDTNLIVSDLILISITGFPGTGKTVLAQHYSDLYINNIKNGNKLRWFIRAGNKIVLNEDYKKLAKKLEISFNKETPLNEIIKKVNFKLKNFASFIIVFDNVEDYKDIDPFIPYNQDVKGQIVITSTNSHLIPADKKCKVLQISLNKGMSELESMMLFNQLTGRPEELSAKLLFKRLGGLPLTLAQSANYIVNEKLSYEEYLKLYEEKYVKPYNIINANAEHSTNNIKKSSYFRYSLDKILEFSINKISPEAQEVLYLIAYFDSDEIPESLFNFINFPNIKLNSILNELETRSLINRDIKRGTLFIHKAVQDGIRTVIREKHLIYNKEDYYITKVLNLIHMEHRLNIITEHDYYKKRYLIPHLVSAINFYNFSTSKQPSKIIVQAMVDLALLYKSIGMASLSKECYNKLLSFISNIEEGIAAEIYKGLGRSYQGNGDFELAKDAYEKSYNIYLKLNYINTPEMAAILNDLGMIFRDIGNELSNKNSNNYYEQATKYLEQAVSISNKLPKQQKNTVRYLTNLGEAYRKIVRLQQAEQIIIKAINMSQQEYLNQKHRLVAAAHFNLGRVYIDKKNYQAAKLCFEKAVEISSDEDVCGRNHPLSARYLNSLGVTWRKLGVEQNACRHFKEAYDILKNGNFGQRQLIEQIQTNINSCNNI